MHTLARLLLPGYAQLRNGQPRKALAVAAALLLALLAAVLTRWLYSPAGLATFLGLLGGGLAWCAFDARRHKGAAPPARLAPAAWALLAAPPLILLAVACVAPLRREVLGLQAWRIPSGHEASAPALQGGDRFLAAMGKVPVGRGDLVLFPAPDDPGTTCVKRVVALAGDVVRADEGGLTVNGARVLEVPARPFGPFTVPPGCCFCVGDNLAESRDCRDFGPVRIDAIEGRPLYVFWSERWDRIGKTLR